jgi:hypothetical protein
MKHIKISLLTGIAVPLLLWSLVSDPLPQPFVNLMGRAAMTFDAPDSMIVTEIKNNSQMNYEYALATPGRHFEVRYAIRPLDSMLAKYNRDTAQKKPGNFSADPNKLHNALLQATLLNVFGGHLPQIRAFPPEAVKNEFNADWGAVASGQPSGAFGAGYQACVVVAIHKDNAGNAYYFYLADSTIVGPGFGRLMKGAFHSLRFKDE